jgi:ABC-type Fe3+ transport system substrate-binding protein
MEVSMMRIRTLTALTGAVAAGALALTAFATPVVAAGSGQRRVPMSEQDQLQALHREAVAEGGEVTVYMGGDAPGQWDALAAAFTQQFPDVRLHLVTDLSKYHDVRIDNQIATGKLVADVAILQTTQDFDRWKKQGDLLKYKPVGWDQVFANAKDKDGYYTGVFYGAFSYLVNNGLIPANPGDFKGTDLLRPEFKDKLILTYPNDDDAVLFGFKQIVDKYGWDYLARLVAQHPTLVRGVPGSSAGVASGSYLASIAVGGDARPNGTQVFSDSERFNTWAQRGAIFKDAPRRAGAKLFLSWLTSQATQQYAIASWTWSVRKDVAPPAGLEPLSSYENTDPSDFVRFMSNRAAVERFRARVAQYVGPVEGPDPADPADSLGETPGAF